MCLPCFLHCNSQTHKASEPGGEAQPAAPSLLSLPGPTTTWQWAPLGPFTLSWLWGGSNYSSTAKIFLDVLAYEREQIFISVLVVEMYSTTIILKNRFADYFLFPVEKKPQPWMWQPLNFSMTASHPEHNIGETRHIQAGMAVIRIWF